LLRLIPPITTVALWEYRIDDPDGAVDLSLPLPAPRLRQHWQHWASHCAAIDQALGNAKGLLREPWLEFDDPFAGKPGVFFRLDHRRGQCHRGVMAARHQLLPTLTTPWFPPELGYFKLQISHCGLFPSRLSHQQGQIRLNLTGAEQWAWLETQVPQLCSLELKTLLDLSSLCWSATFDWGVNGLTRLGFELYPAGRLQRASTSQDPSVINMLQALSPWCPATAIEHCRHRHHKWLQESTSGHVERFSHIKLSPNVDGVWSMKLYLLSHATG
jgi:hypothetical protein